jgi:hypothetical protein
MLVGCLGPSTPDAPGSGFHGVATIGPTCPVQREPPDPGCADRPYQGTFAATSADGSRVVATFASDAEGRFNVSVPAGAYAIRLADESKPLPRCASEGTIVVAPGAWTLANVTCDSGIR